MDANKSNIPYREQPSPVDESLRAHNHPGMEDRMARMEVNIAYIRRDVDELRIGFHGISKDIGSLKAAIQSESSKRQEQFTELRSEIGDVRLSITAMDSRLDRKLEQHLLKLQSRMLWTIGATVGPIVLAWFIQTFLPALRASGG